MSEGDQKEGERGFKVEDRRRFSESGDVKEEFKDQEEGPSKPADSGEKPAAERQGREPLPEISFSTFLIGLSTQALMHLGEIPNPVSQTVESDLEGAKEMIDILGILQKKTEGNLDSDEQALMEHVLYDLRIRYVERARHSA